MKRISLMAFFCLYPYLTFAQSRLPATLGYCERKARESEMSGSWTLGMITVPTTVSIYVDGNEVSLPLPQGLVIKKVNDAYHTSSSSRDKFLAYFSLPNKNIAFLIPKNAVSVATYNSEDWKKYDADYKQMVAAFKQVQQQSLLQEQAAPQQN